MPEEKTSLSESARSSSLVMLCTLISRILGFVRIALLGAVFGARGTADALNAAFSVPNNLRKLLAEGALSSAFIPVLARTLVKDPSGAKRIVRKILTFQLIVIIPLCLAAILAADPLMRYVLAEFEDQQLVLLGARLLRWLMAYLLLMSISAVLMGVLQSHARFLAPALTPILFSVAVIGCVALLHKHIGPFSMAVGVLVGGVAQVLFQTPLFIKLGYSFLPDTQFKDQEFRSVLRQWLPVLATASIFTITQQVAVRFATGLAEGSASALQYAIVFWQLPFGVFSASITTVLFPKMSKEVSEDDRKSLRETVAFGLRSMWAFLVPSAALLVIYREQIVNVAMHRGNFDAAATVLTARVLSGYAVGLFGVGAYTFLQRFFLLRRALQSPIDVGISACHNRYCTLHLVKKHKNGSDGPGLSKLHCFHRRVYCSYYTNSSAPRWIAMEAYHGRICKGGDCYRYCVCIFYCLFTSHTAILDSSEFSA